MIGSGKYAVVYRAIDTSTNEIFVVKQILLINDIDGEIEENYKVIF